MYADVSVIKVGGSLLDWPELPDRLSVFLEGQRNRVASGRLVAIAGGGPAADLARRLDRDHHLGDETAHQLAIHAMDLTARFLAAILPGSVAVDRLAELFSVWSAGRVPVLIPSPILQDIERTGMSPLPRSWDTTSDSIAAWIATHLRATSLVLLKSASLPSGADRQMAARLERVDPHFPRISRDLPRVEYLNLRDPAGHRLTLDREDLET
jgi:5-(aminomethyl)-3-furanmethanol phosphate kinase